MNKKLNADNAVGKAIISGKKYLQKILSDKSNVHDVIHVKGEDELYIKESYAKKAVDIERKYQLNRKKEKFNESFLIKFSEYIKEDFNPNQDVFKFLASLKDTDLNEMINDLISSDDEHTEDHIEDILIEIGNIVDDEQYSWVNTKLKELITHKKNYKQLW